VGEPHRYGFRGFSSTPGRSRRAVSWAAGQPGWVARAAGFAAVLVAATLVLLLIIPALVIGALVFVVLGFTVAARARLARWRAGREASSGRENVRVIRRDHEAP